MATEDLDATVTEDVDGHRYVITVDGQEVGAAVYVDKGGRRLFVHTEVDDAQEGRGVGSRLVRGALSDARDRRIPVVALCPFVAGWLERHPEMADVVDTRMTDVIEQGG